MQSHNEMQPHTFWMLLSDKRRMRKEEEEVREKRERGRRERWGGGREDVMVKYGD